jgi:DNA-binding NarL/FixJ family response regulator
MVARAGLKSLMEQTGECLVLAPASPAEVVSRAAETNPGVILWQLEPDEDPAALHALIPQRVVLLTNGSAADLIRAGARGVLPVNASEEQIGLAVRAAAADLVVTFADATAVAATASGLTPRETEVLRMVAEGLANKEIAYRLGISEHTVKFHVSSMLGKLGAGSRAEAIGLGIRQGLILL